MATTQPSTQALKQAVAAAAIEIMPKDCVIGVGTGSTANCFIDLLGEIAPRIEGAVASSEASAERLRQNGIDVLDLNSAGPLPVYVDGADEANPQLHLIKGGGGALTREKIVAAASEQFICVVDESKLVKVLGEYPLPIEVIPMARSYVARQIVVMGGDPELREGTVTDNGNLILDIYNMELIDPVTSELHLNQIAGVVSVGLFAARPADVLLVAKSDGSIEKHMAGN